MKKNKNEKQKLTNKKTIIKIVLISISYVLTTIGLVFTYFNYKNNYKYYFSLNTNEITVKLNEIVYPEKYIKNAKNVDVEYDVITTNTLGKRYLSYTVTDMFSKHHYYYITVNVVDDVAPTIDGKDKVTVYTGSKLDLKSYIKASDNYDKDLSINIDGEVDTSKEGTYDVLYTVTDKSGNKSSYTIKFTVKKKETYVAPSNNSNSGTTSKGYKIESKNGVIYIKGILIANKTYALPSSYGNGLTSSTKSAFNELKDAAANDGYKLYIGSGYRSYKTQNTVYNNYVKRDGQAKADTYSARPGHSEHQSGLALDICAKGYKCIGSGFNGTAAANWLSSNAYKYGFILRYPNGKTNETGYKFESWHYRYVGKELAETLYNNGDWITLESYLGITSKYSS